MTKSGAGTTGYMCINKFLQCDDNCSHMLSVRKRGNNLYGVSKSQCVTKNHSYYEIVLHCSKMAVLARVSQVVQHMMGSIKLKNWMKQQETSSVCAIVNAMSENAVIFQLHTVALHNVNSAHKIQLSSHIKVCFIYFLSA